MKYFILELDKAYVPPMPLNWYGKLDVKTLTGKKHYQLPKYMVFQIEQQMQTVWTDIIMHPCFMVGKPVKDVLERYEPSLRFVRVIFSDKEKARSKAYYIPSLMDVPALTANSQFNMNRSVIHYGEIDERLLRDQTIVRISNVNQANCILIRSDLAESILTNDTIGIGLTEVDAKIGNMSERSRF